MIDTTVGDLFNSGDPSDLAKAVCRCLADPKGRVEQAQRGRERVLSMYTYEHNAAAYEAIYASVIKNQPDSPLLHT